MKTYTLYFESNIIDHMAAKIINLIKLYSVLDDSNGCNIEYIVAIDNSIGHNEYTFRTFEAARETYQDAIKVAANIF